METFLLDLEPKLIFVAGGFRGRGRRLNMDDESTECVNYDSFFGDDGLIVVLSRRYERRVLQCR